MYGKIKELAAAAIMLQNKGAMDSALREIGALAEQAFASGVGEVGHVGFGGNQVDKVWIDEAPQALSEASLTAALEGAVTLKPTVAHIAMPGNPNIDASAIQQLSKASTAAKKGAK